MNDQSHAPAVFDNSRRTQTFTGEDDLYLKEMDQKTNGAFSRYRAEYARISNFGIVDYPIHIEIENVYACNLKCGHCARQYASIDDKQFMDPSLFRSIIDQATSIGTKSIGFATWGELLMDRRIFDKFDYARNRGILDIRVHSNGVILNEQKADRLVASGVTWLSISLDAVTAETYAKVRGGNFEKAQSAIGYIINAKLRRNTHVPKLRVSFVKQKANEDEAQRFIEKFHGVADVTIQDFRNSMGLIPAAAVSDYYPSDSWIDPSSSQCNQPFERVFIRHDGTVVPCCSDIENRLAFGNLKQMSLKEIFNSAKAKVLRDKHLKCCPPELCKFCLTH
jgi:radical SAM protein with 4Fe4S-binding SPASM domain